MIASACEMMIACTIKSGPMKTIEKNKLNEIKQIDKNQRATHKSASKTCQTWSNKTGIINEPKSL